MKFFSWSLSLIRWADRVTDASTSASDPLVLWLAVRLRAKMPFAEDCSGITGVRSISAIVISVAGSEMAVPSTDVRKVPEAEVESS